jgi:hypothetical protein
VALVAGIVIAVGWWLWPTLASEAITTGAAYGSASAPAPGTDSIALVLTTPTPTPAPEASQAAAARGESVADLMQIVVVTPTPDPRRRLVVGGTIVDRPLAVTGREQDAGPGGAVLTSASISLTIPGFELLPEITFDLSGLQVPPVIEEIVNAPVPEVEVIPIPGVELPGSPATATPAATAPPTPTAVPEVPVGVPTRLWSSFVPPAPEANDHLWVETALSPEYNQIAAPSYQFGSTAGGRYRPHHGVDIANPSGTPVRAGVSGTVVHAGLDEPALIGPYNNFYGNCVVILLDRKLPVGGGEMNVYVLYGHLSQVTVAQGQQVGPNDIVGAVGMTGIAIGPHLHVEMRVGANTYQNSVNPYLWMKPLAGNGAVAVRLVTADGRSWPGARLTLARFEDGRAVWGRMIETYRDDEGIGPNPNWGENGAMGDVPAGFYVLVGNVNGEPIRAEFFVREGQTTFVEVRTQQ